MQIVTSAVRVFVHEMALDVLGLSPCASRRKTLGRSAPLDAEMLGRPSLPGLFRQQHVHLVGRGCALRHGGKGVRRPSSCGSAVTASTRAAHCNVLVDTSLSLAIVR